MAPHQTSHHPGARVPLSRRLRAHLDLADPITWVAPATMVFCGAVASRSAAPNFQLRDMGDLLLMILGVLMCGPLATGFSQSINDYFDRDLDAINDPARPIPSGLVSLGEARANWVGLGVGTMAVSLYLARYSLWIPVLVGLGLLVAAAYSVPPIKLKQSFWLGPPAVGLGYVCITWVIGHLIFAPLTWPSLTLALIDSALAAGLLFLNDVKSVEGDRQLGLNSLTVALGVSRALVVSYAVIGLCELAMLVLALLAGYLWAAGLAGVALLVPIYSQVRLYRDPTRRNFMRYLLASNPLVLIIQIISAFIVGGYFG